MSRDDEDRKTPIPIGIKKSHSKRLDDLETGQGKLAGDIGKVSARVKVLEDIEDQRNSDRPSNAQFSLSPTGARAKFQNVNVWAIVIVVIVIALMFAVIALIVGK